MNISPYQKRFGAGLEGLAWSLALFALLWLLDVALGHVETASSSWPLRLAGCGLIGAWIFWHVWCLRTIRAWWANNSLCTSGPYRFVRHPVYAGGIFGAGTGTALLFNSWILLLWPVLVYPVWSLLARREEKVMLALFGDAYRQYMRRTGRLCPRLHRSIGRGLGG